MPLLGEHKLAVTEATPIPSDKKTLKMPGHQRGVGRDAAHTFPPGGPVRETIGYALLHVKTTMPDSKVFEQKN